MKYVECKTDFQGSSGRYYKKGEVFPILHKIGKTYYVIEVEGEEKQISTIRKFRALSDFENNLVEVLK